MVRGTGLDNPAGIMLRWQDQVSMTCVSHVDIKVCQLVRIKAGHRLVIREAVGFKVNVVEGEV